MKSRIISRSSAAVFNRGWMRSGLVSGVLLSAVLSWPGAQLQAQTVPAANTGQVDTALLDINSADVESIAAALDGIGLVKARAIVEYREANGEFLHLDELQDVPGIGEVTLDRIRHLLTLDAAGNKSADGRLQSPES